MNVGSKLTDPFEEWRSGTPYWLRDETLYCEVHRERHRQALAKLEAVHRGQHEASKSPNPLARSWHDL